MKPSRDLAYRRARYAKLSREQKLSWRGVKGPANNIAKSRAKVAMIMAYKAERGCRICGERDPIVLDLDHRDQAEKSFTISEVVWKGMPIAKIMAEMEKCDVLCANCHRRKTAVQLGWYAKL